MGAPLFETEVSAASAITTAASFDTLVYPSEEVDAINELLAVIGEHPVNSAVETTPTVHMAKQMLAMASRRVQSYGWRFNTEADVLVDPDAASKFPIGPNWIRFWPDAGDYTDKELVARGQFVYDLVNRTYLLGLSQLKVNVVFFLRWAEVPENARAAIVARAARRFHAAITGDEARAGWLKEDEVRAWAELRQDDSEWSGYNVLSAGAARAAVARGRTPTRHSAKATEL